MAIQLQKFMERVGIKNQQQLASKLGLTQAAISSWNIGIRKPKYEDCVKLLSFGMTIEELFGEDIAKIYFEKNIINKKIENIDENNVMKLVKSALKEIINT